MPETTATPPKGKIGRPKGATREKILDVALDLFTDNGYDKTSLREIADALGFTKAALYYHFERKEDLLLALHLRLHALGNEALGKLVQLGSDGAGLEAWIEVLDDFVDQVLENRKLFLFHQRNEQALEQINEAHHNEAGHEDMQEQLMAVLRSSAYPVRLRVRMACAIGAVLGALMGSGEAFRELPTGELADMVREAIRDLLPVKSVARRRP